MKLTLDNIIFSLQPMGGISVYWYELLKRLARDSHIEAAVFQFSNSYTHLLAEELNNLELATQVESNIPVRLLRCLPFRTPVARQSLFHSSYYRIAEGAKNIVTIYDFTYEYYRQGVAKWLHSTQKFHAINKAAGIICISENTRTDLYQFFPDLDVPVEVIYIGKSDIFKSLPETYHFSKTVQSLISLKYVLFVGARGGYKNFSTLVEALTDCSDITLVIVGPQLSQEESAFLQRKIAGRYRFLGFVDDVLLNELYNQAYCFIYPSEYEGFGIPVSEAMAAGCPVIAMAKSSILEVAGDTGLLCEHLNAETLRQFFALLDDPVQRQQLISHGIAQAEKFSWDKCYAQTIEFYNKIDKLA